MASKINVTLGLDVSAFQKGLAQATAKLDAFSKRAQNMGSTLSQNVTLPLVGLGAAAVKSFADFSKLENSLAAVMGSSEGAKQEMIALRKVAENPGLAIPQVVQASARLQSVGISAAEARTVITEFGNAVARAGGNADTLDGVVLALTQISAAGKVTQEDLNQIKERLPEFGRVMKEEFGTTTAEGIRALGVSSEEFIQRATKALGGLERANGGLANSFDNFKDSVQGSLAQLGGVIAEAFDLEGILTKLGEAVQNAANWFSQLSPGVQKAIVLFAAFAASIGPVFFIVGKLAGAMPILAQGFAALTSPIGLAVAAIGLVVIAFATANSKVNELQAAQQKLADVSKTAEESILSETTEAKRLTGVIQDETKSRTDKLAALKELQRIAPNYFGNIKDEKDLVEKTTTAYQNYSAELLKAAKIQAAKQSLVDIEKGLLNVIETSKPSVWQEIGIAFRGAFNPIGNAAERFKTFTNNVDNNTRSLSAQRDALVKLLDELGKPVEVKTNIGKSSGGGDKGVGADIPTLDTSEYDKQLTNLSSRLYDFANNVKKPFGFIRTSLQDLSSLTPQVTAQKDALLEYSKSLDSIAQKSALFGENPLAAQIDTTRIALENALVAFGPSSEAVAFLKTEYEGLTNQLTILNEQQATQAKLGETISSIIGNIGQSFTDAISGAISFGEAMRRVITDVISLLIQELVITVVKNTANSPLGKLLGPAIVPVAGAAGVAAGSLAKSLLNKVKLANGGLAYGPTLATVGDNPGAISDPEVIAPLSKLKDYLNGGEGYIAETRISGNDLLILVSNAERRNGRIR